MYAIMSTWMNLFSYDQPGGSCCTAHILQTCHIFFSTVALRTIRKYRSSCLCQQCSGHFSSPSWPTFVWQKFKLAASPVVTSLVLGKGLWGISFVPWSSAELLLARGSAQGCSIWTCSESEESGDTSGVLQLCYCTCVALGFFTGDLFPNSYFPFSHVFSLFHYHSMTWIKVIQNRRPFL